MKIIFWSEFPKEVNWVKVKDLHRKYNLKSEIYVACKSLQDFRKWKKIISSKEIAVGAWPILSKKEGYWFSGFCSKKSINKLNNFSGLKVKIDLELPIPAKNYSDFNILVYFLGMLSKKAQNSEYLYKTIDKLSKKSRLIVNEFPLSKNLRENAGIFYQAKRKNATKNIMLYSTIPSKILRPFLRYYLHNFARRAVKEGNVMFSIGLIGTGILNTEGTYGSIEEFKRDLDFVKSFGIKAVAIYSIDSISKKTEAEEWIKLIKDYSK